MENSSTTNTSKLPISKGLSLQQQAMRVADMQDHGASFRDALNAARVYYAKQRRVCPQYRPWIDPRQPQYVDTLCRSGFVGKLLTPACTGCDALLADFHPRITHRPGGYTLVQIKAA